jgi:hypothetical protein
MQDTRVQLLTDIISWAVAPASPAVFWLNGLAGTGKSTVARTICETLEEMSMLGASFFICCQVAERRHAPNVLRTLAYQLARQQPEFSNAITETLLNSPELASSESLQKLAAKLLFEPAGVLAADDRLVIVIDAMDECSEDTNGRPGGELLPILLRGLLQLSGRVKILITSRAEPEIVRVFDLASLGSDQKMVQLHYLDGAVVRSDIRTYLSQSFANIAAASPNLTMLKWPSQEEIDVLVELSDVLFIFAASVVRFVGTAKQNPRTRLEILLANPKGRLASPYRFLDQLYLQVLRASVRSDIQEDEETLSGTLRIVVGSIVTAQYPLSISTHAILLETDPEDVRLMIGSLSALILHANDEPVRTFHPSFPDFISDPGRCDDPRFLISSNDTHLRLARGCLALLNRHLRYNIAELEDPDVANSDVEDLEDRLLRGICEEEHHLERPLPPALFYAARYWTTHIASCAKIDSELLDALSCFCNNHLLHWIELLSLVRSLAYNTQSDLLAVIRWCEVRSSSRTIVIPNRFARLPPVMSEFLRSNNCFMTLCKCWHFTPSPYGHMHCISFTLHI